MAAEPVPVLLPGVTLGVPGVRPSAIDVGDWATGSTNVGFHRKASQRSSIHDAQLETMMSPAVGFQASGADRLKRRRVVEG